MQSFKELIKFWKQTGDHNQLLQQIPYSKKIGIDCYPLGNDIIFRLKQQETNIGNPRLPAIHGGVISGFMEHAALFHIIFCIETPELPKTIDLSIDYLRAGRFQDTFAMCKVNRHGKRVVNAVVTSWQTTQEEPIAIARGNFLVA